MKKLLILIVFTAVFLHFYPQENLNAWYNEQKAWLIDKFSSATDTKVRLNTSKIFQDLKPKFQQFKPNEQKFLQEITSNREALMSFYEQHCKKKKASAHLHSTNQKITCKTISNYQSLM